MNRPPTKPSECPDHAVRYHDNGDARAVVFFAVFPHRLDFFILHPDGLIHADTDRVLDTINDPDDHVWAKGSLKWDGCINFDIGSSIDGTKAHACTEQMLRDGFDDVAWIYTLGHKIPAWDGNHR